MPRENLWGAIPSADAYRSPTTILREQAAKLGELTNGILDARLRRVPLARVTHVTFDQGPRNALTYSFDIIATALDDYSYTVLLVSHGPTGYPVEVYEDPDMAPRECADEKDFKSAVSLILNSDRVLRVVQALIAQSTAVSES